MAKDFGKDYGVRPALFKNYPDMMSTVSKKAVFDVRVEPDSEFEKPYLTDDYNEQQQIHQLNFAVPYLPPAALGVSATNPTGTLPDKGNLLMDAKLSVNGAKLDFPSLTLPEFLTGDVKLVMDGYDRNNKSWSSSDITWSIIQPPDYAGIDFDRLVIDVNSYNASSDSDITLNIVGTNTTGERSNIVVNLSYNRYILEGETYTTGTPNYVNVRLEMPGAEGGTSWRGRYRPNSFGNDVPGGYFSIFSNVALDSFALESSSTNIIYLTRYNIAPYPVHVIATDVNGLDSFETVIQGY